MAKVAEERHLEERKLRNDPVKQINIEFIKLDPDAL